MNESGFKEKTLVANVNNSPNLNRHAINQHIGKCEEVQFTKKKKGKSDDSSDHFKPNH